MDWQPNEAVMGIFQNYKLIYKKIFSWYKLVVATNKSVCGPHCGADIGLLPLLLFRKLKLGQEKH
jgi:hypothetical protein